MALGFFKRRQSEERAEMSFVDHLEILRGHLFRSALAVAVGAIIVGIYNKFVIREVLLGPTQSDFPTYSILCRIGHRMGLEDGLCMKEVQVLMQNTSVTGPMGQFFSVVFIGGFIMAFSYIFWEFWRFIKPALTKKELQKTRGVIFWVSLLFFTGVLFGYFILAPYTINFFSNFQLDEMIKNEWTIASYIDTLTPLILGCGLAFQLPLAMLFLAKVGIVSPDYLRRMRKYAIVIIVILSGFITPPDVVSQIIVTLPLLLLYEISIILTARVKKQEEAEWD
jgi:sec-independent protein translocase protein TatC